MLFELRVARRQRSVLQFDKNAVSLHSFAATRRGFQLCTVSTSVTHVVHYSWSELTPTGSGKKSAVGSNEKNKDVL